MRPRYEVADIFRMYGDAYRKTHAMNPGQRKVMAAVMACRTAIQKYVIIVDQSETATTPAVTGIARNVKP